jgi:hypothetical protein
VSLAVGGLGKVGTMARRDPRSREIDSDDIEGSLKALRLEPGDLVVVRIPEGDRQTAERASKVLSDTLDATGRGVTGIILSSECEIERIPFGMAKKILANIVKQHEDGLAALCSKARISKR